MRSESASISSRFLAMTHVPAVRFVSYIQIIIGVYKEGGIIIYEQKVLNDELVLKG